MFSNFHSSLSRYHINLFGWRTKRRIIVLESDDWGSIRMPSKSVFNFLKSKKINVDQCPYLMFDSLASEDDLTYLFEVLSSFKDFKGNHPIITANTVVVNPDFDKIKNDKFNNYNYELFTKTLLNYPRHSKSFNLWIEGINKKIFFPQYHGREHVNISLWLTLLKKKIWPFNIAFDNGMWGLGPNVVKVSPINIQATYDALELSELELHKKSLIDGLNIFETIFGYRSESFIPNNFILDLSLLPYLRENGIKYLQGMKYHLSPLFNSSIHPKMRRILGKINNQKQIQLLRNCFFEPSFNEKCDWVNNCLRDIRISFLLNKPAVISLHRVNFIGYINEKNRDKNLQYFHSLLKEILKNWPNVEFMTSVELGELILNDMKKLNN